MVSWSLYGAGHKESVHCTHAGFLGFILRGIPSPCLSLYLAMIDLRIMNLQSRWIKSKQACLYVICYCLCCTVMQCNGSDEDGSHIVRDLSGAACWEPAITSTGSKRCLIVWNNVRRWFSAHTNLKRHTLYSCCILFPRSTSE